MRAKLEMMTADLTGAKEYCSSLERRLEEAQDQTERAHREIERVQTEAELNAYRRVADKAKKWEERESRLVRRIDELERGIGIHRRAGESEERRGTPTFHWTSGQRTENRYDTTLGRVDSEPVNQELATGVNRAVLRSVTLQVYK